MNTLIYSFSNVRISRGCQNEKRSENECFLGKEGDFFLCYPLFEPDLKNSQAKALITCVENVVYLFAQAL